jgi:hypothetical protein
MQDYAFNVHALILMVQGGKYLKFRQKSNFWHGFPT